MSKGSAVFLAWTFNLAGYLTLVWIVLVDARFVLGCTMAQRDVTESRGREPSVLDLLVHSVVCLLLFYGARHFREVAEDAEWS